jgi:hypothetical protein
MKRLTITRARGGPPVYQMNGIISQTKGLYEQYKDPLKALYEAYKRGKEGTPEAAPEEAAPPPPAAPPPGTPVVGGGLGLGTVMALGVGLLVLGAVFGGRR